jgi:hypothetical protein
LGYQGKRDPFIGTEPAIQVDILLTVELAHFLALGNQGADAGPGEEGGDAGAAQGCSVLINN